MSEPEVIDQSRNTSDESSVIDKWFLPLPETGVNYQLADERVPVGTFTVHCRERDGNQFLLSLKNDDQIDQLIITCIPQECKYHVGNDTTVDFSNLAHVVLNILKNKVKISVSNNRELIFKTCLKNPIPVQTYFLAGVSDEDEAKKYIDSLQVNNRFAVWLRGDGIFNIGIKNNDFSVIPIASYKRGFTLDGSTYFGEINMLINHYSKFPLPDRDSEFSKTLPRPVEVSCFHASMIYHRIEELLKPCPHLGQGKDMFHQEFSEMESKSKRNSFGFSEAKKEQYKVKNRYGNVLAYDHTRVKLRDQQEDYINANFVEGDFQSYPPAYICCQAPMNNTIDDHWRMIVQEKVKIIIILTNIEEKGVHKCSKYWPDGDEVFTACEHFSITVEHEEFVRDILSKRLLVKNSNDDSEHRLLLMQYTAWPDFGVPKHSWGILELLIKLNTERRSIEPPTTIIHCSAGIGRTGAFLILDMILNKIHANGSPLFDLGMHTVVDIKETIVEARTQRTLLVSTVDQYKFIHVTLLRYIQWKIGQSSFQI